MVVKDVENAIRLLFQYACGDIMWKIKHSYQCGEGAVYPESCMEAVIFFQQCLILLLTLQTFGEFLLFQ